MRIKRTDEEKQQIVEQVDALVAGGMTIKDAVQQVGADLSTYYRIKRVASPTSNHTPVMGLRFEVIGTEEAKALISTPRGGRFSELKENLLRELRGLTGNYAISFPAPADKKEAIAVQAACVHAIKMARLPFRVRYVRAKSLIVIVRTDSIKKEEEANAELVQR